MLLLIVAALQAASLTLTDADRADGLCAATMVASLDRWSATNGSAQSTDPEAGEGLRQAYSFFVGRISGRSGPAAIDPAVRDGAGRVTDAMLVREGNRCADIMDAVLDGG